MTHIPSSSQPAPEAGHEPWGQQPAPGSPDQSAAPAAQPGPPQGWVAADPATNQAALRYSARAKNNTVAWLLWIGGPFLVGLPIHDFYFGAILRGLLKIGLLVLAFVALFAGILGTALTSIDGSAGRSPPSTASTPARRQRPVPPTGREAPAAVVGSDDAGSGDDAHSAGSA